jgi:hypothetical protein
VLGLRIPREAVSQAAAAYADQGTSAVVAGFPSHPYIQPVLPPTGGISLHEGRGLVG